MESPMGLYWQGSEEYRPAVRRLLPLYENWVEAHLAGDQTAKQFARFLGSPAAVDLVPSGVTWLAQALPSFRDSSRDSLDEIFVDLLRNVWRRIPSYPALKAPFQELFAWVVQRATPAALNLQEEIQPGGISNSS